VDERLSAEISNYRLQHRLILRGETWELWQGYREIAKLRYQTGSEVIDFPGEWVGDRILKLHIEVDIPAQVEIGGHELDEPAVAGLAARMHVALCSMKVRNVVARKTPWPSLSESERDRILVDFQRWMKQRGWRATVDRADEKILIRGRQFCFSRDKPSDAEIVDQGTWVAKAWHALLYKEVDRTVLFVSEGARLTSNWLAELRW